MLSIKDHPSTYTGAQLHQGAASPVLPVQYSDIATWEKPLLSVGLRVPGLCRLQHQLTLAFWKRVSRKDLLLEIIYFRRKLFFQASTLMWSGKTSTLTPALSHSTSVRGWWVPTWAKPGEDLRPSVLTWALGAHLGPAQREAAASGPQCGRKLEHLLPQDTDALEVSIFFVVFKPYDYFF